MEIRSGVAEVIAEDAGGGVAAANGQPVLDDQRSLDLGCKLAEGL